jgi:hypothetical protein
VSKPTDEVYILRKSGEVLLILIYAETLGEETISHIRLGRRDVHILENQAMDAYVVLVATRIRESAAVRALAELNRRFEAFYSDHLRAHWDGDLLRFDPLATLLVRA